MSRIGSRVESGIFEKLGRRFARIGTSPKSTIQRPEAAAIEKSPATNAQANVRPETGRARRSERRASAVLRGQPRPPRTCHISQRRGAMTTTAQGKAGVVFKLTNASAPQTP